jgi:protein pelota
MKLLHKELDKDGEGTVTIVPEEAEDMFCVYNLLQQGDSLKSSTIRKVQKESTTGSSTSEKLKITLTVAVEAVQFDPDSGMLRVKGRNIAENEFVKMNAYHTIDLEPNRKFTLKKVCWDVVAMEMLDEACDPKNKADIGAVVMAEGLANVVLMTSSMSLVRAKIEAGIPRKRGAAMAHGAHDKAMEKFFESVQSAHAQADAHAHARTHTHTHTRTHTHTHTHTHRCSRRSCATSTSRSSRSRSSPAQGTPTWGPSLGSPL